MSTNKSLSDKLRQRIEQQNENVNSLDYKEKGRDPLGNDETEVSCASIVMDVRLMTRDDKGNTKYKNYRVEIGDDSQTICKAESGSLENDGHEVA